MASNFYNGGLQRLLSGNVNYTSGTTKMLVVDNTYTFNVTHEYVSNISGEVSGTGYARMTLSGKTVSVNSTTNVITMDCADPSMANVSTSNFWAGGIVFDDTGNDNTSALIGFLDFPETSVNNVTVNIVIPSTGILELTNNVQ